MKNYLAHHGVAGQKWGQRHGPPYPLSRDPANAKRAQADHKKNKASTKTSSNSPRVSRGTTPSSMQVHVMNGIISDRKYRKELAKKQKQEQKEYEEAQRAEKAAAVKRRKYLEKEAKKGRLTRDEQEEYTELVWSDKRQAEAEAAKQQAQQEKYQNTMKLVSSAAVMTQKVAMAAERIGYARNALSIPKEYQKDRKLKLKIRQMELNTDIVKTKINAEAGIGIKKNKQNYNNQKSKDTGYNTKNKYKTFNKDKYSTPKPQNTDTTYKKRWKEMNIWAKNKDGSYQRNDVITNYRRSQFTQKTMETKLSSAYADYTKSKYVSYADLQPSVKSIKVSESSLNRIKESQQRRTRMEGIARQKAITQSLQRDFLNSKANKNAYYSMRHSMFLSPEEQMLLYLAHHGIPGQKWGQRHGPPYPLNDDTSRAIRKNRINYDLSTYKFNAREYRRVKQAVDEQKKIKETISDFKKLKNTDIESIIDGVNPIKHGDGRNFNCQNSSVAMSLRFQGYDVQARLNDDFSNVGNLEEAFISGKFKTVNVGSWKNKAELADRHKQLSTTLKAEMLKDPVGSTGIFMMPGLMSDDSNHKTSVFHAVNYKITKNGIYFYDGQASKKNAICKYDEFPWVCLDPRDVQFMRTDNLQPSEKVTKYVISKERGQQVNNDK